MVYLPGMDIMFIRWNIDFGFRKNSLKLVKLCDANFDSENLSYILFTLNKRKRTVCFWMHLLLTLLPYLLYSWDGTGTGLPYQYFVKTNHGVLSKHFWNLNENKKEGLMFCNICIIILRKSLSVELLSALIPVKVF